MALLSRALLESVEAADALARHKLAFPLLLRSPGFHTGRFFTRVDNALELAACLPALPGGDILVMQFLAAQSDDGKIRKFRVMLIDGVLYPLHVAISHEWKIHYFTAEMADNPEHRAEDAAFLEHMPEVLGPRALGALQTIATVLGLDYAGVDFSVGPEGELLLFEANAAMIVYAPDNDPRWDYRRPAVNRILRALREVLLKQVPVS
jgi:glutathione synthase/RimK-type ligase-like ATP-grasp enzyme